jgi:cytochrome c-type biogenesis protein
VVELSALGAATATAAGLVSFLSPCVLPLVPGYVSFIAGSSLERLEADRATRLRALGLAACFVLGFSAVFMALGASATALGGLLLAWRREVGLVAGLLVVLFGLHMLGFSPLGLLAREARVQLDLPGGRPGRAALMGAAFAFGWTPCIGPVLGAILTLGANTGDIAAGTTLLGFYALGLGLPFLAAAWFTTALLGRLRRLSRLGRDLQRAAGAVLVVMGLLMATGRLEIVAWWLLETFPALARIG